MSNKIKHNKKRNTAFLYEALVRELTKATMRKDGKKKNTIVSIFKEFFKPHSPLARDLKLYQNILETKVDDKRLAEKIVLESRLEKSAIDSKVLFNEQSALISRINKELSTEVYTNFVPNYKDLATLHQIFNNPKIEAKQRVLLEETIISGMIIGEEKKQLIFYTIHSISKRQFLVFHHLKFYLILVMEMFVCLVIYQNSLKNMVVILYGDLKKAMMIIDGKFTNMIYNKTQ